MDILPMQKIEITARGDLVFQPDGYHIMLMQPRQHRYPSR